MIYLMDMQGRETAVMLSKKEVLERLIGEVPDGTFALALKTNTRTSQGERVTIFIPAKGMGDAYAEIK